MSDTELFLWRRRFAIFDLARGNFALDPSHRKPFFIYSIMSLLDNTMTIENEFLDEIAVLFTFTFVNSCNAHLSAVSDPILSCI